jgi:hypothetical protein
MGTADRALTFEGLLGPAPSVPSNLDRDGRPYVRRTTDGHVIVVTDPLRPLPSLSWVVVYARCPAGCDGGRGVGAHRTDLKPGDRLGDEHVGAWPFLNQWGYHQDWVLEQIDGLQKAVKAHRRTYGVQSAKIGALRADLARARERIRELEAGQRGAPGLPPYVADLPRVLEEHSDGERIGREITGILGAMATSYASLHRPAASRPVAKFFNGCREISGTWLHGRPHDCPKWARG